VSRNELPSCVPEKLENLATCLQHWAFSKNASFRVFDQTFCCNLRAGRVSLTGGLWGHWFETVANITSTDSCGQSKSNRLYIFHWNSTCKPLVLVPDLQPKSHEFFARRFNKDKHAMRCIYQNATSDAETILLVFAWSLQPRFKASEPASCYCWRSC